MGSGDCSSVQELHVLAVDDSLVDRKVIERLLKISCCKGVFFSSLPQPLWGVCLFLDVFIELLFCLLFAVTAVESGRRALQYLGLDGETKTSLQFDVRTLLHPFSHCPVFVSLFSILGLKFIFYVYKVLGNWKFVDPKIERIMID